MLSQKDAAPPPETERAASREQGVGAAGERRLWRVWEDVRRGAAHFPQGGAPSPDNRLEQFAHGLCLPFHMARAFFEERAALWRYLKVGTFQALTVLVLAVLFTGSGREVVERVEPEARRSVRWVVYWAAFFSALQIAQWIVIALSRDYHTALSRELSLRVGLAPEDEPLTPRVRLNLPWLRNKMKRRWRGLLAFAVAMPLFYFLKALLPGGEFVFPVLVFLWGAWWFVVFTAAKSARAWEEPAAREPWFLRGWSWLSARVAFFRWSPFNVYNSLWTTFTRSVFSPAASVERQPWTLSGLAVVRALSVLPLFKCYLRPLVPVAATWLLAQEGPGEGGASRPGAASAPESGSPPPAPAPGGATPPRG